MNSKMPQLKSAYSAFSSYVQIIGWSQVHYDKYFLSISYVAIYFISTYASKYENMRIEKKHFYVVTGSVR